VDSSMAPAARGSARIITRPGSAEAQAVSHSPAMIRPTNVITNKLRSVCDMAFSLAYRFTTPRGTNLPVYARQFRLLHALQTGDVALVSRKNSGAIFTHDDRAI